MATVQLRSDFCFFILCTVLSISYLNPVSCNTTETINPSSSIEAQPMNINSSEMTMETSSFMSTEQTSMYNTTDDSSYFSAIKSTATEEIVSSESNVISSIDSTPSSANTVTMSGSMTSYFSEISTSYAINSNSSEKSSVFLSTTSMMNADIIQSSTAFVSTAVAAIINGTQTLDTGMFSSTHTVVSTINPNQSSVDEMSETIGISTNISPTSSESATMSVIVDGTESQTIGMFSSHTVVSASDISQSFVGEMTNTIASSFIISIYPSEQGSTSSNKGQISHTAMTSNSLDITGQITSMQVSLTDSNTENIIMSSTTVDILPTSSFSQGSDVVTTSSVVPTTTTTTTQQPTTALPDKIVSGIGANSVFKIKTDIILITCGSITNSEELRSYILGLLEDITKVRDVIVIYNPCNGSGRKKRSELITRTETVIGALNANSTTVADDIIDALNKTGNTSISNPEDFKNDVERQVSDVCNSNVCDNYVGYNCIKINNTHANCDSQCFDEKCSGHGECKTIISGANQFGKKCICHSEEYYKYEGEQCETKTMKWELAVAITGGSGGAVILILIFILILCCYCKSKENSYEYRQDSYDPMSEVLGRPGPAHYRNEGIKTHQSGMVNIGYDLDDQYSEVSDLRQQQPTNGQSWNPDNSKETYAKISEKLDQGNNYQIKRPHVSGARQSESGEVTTGF